jgi:hypothetical protein
LDAEKFDKVVLDLLYDELDELTRASAIRHMEQSGRAKALYSELRATREVGSLPLIEPPAGLEERILEAEERARTGRPLRQRVGTMVSIVASYAMRPQVGMAAVLLLMVGSSLLFLRVKPGEPSSVQVTERGVPESDKEAVAVVPAPATPAPPRGEESAAARPAARARAVEQRPSDLADDKMAGLEEAARSGATHGADFGAPAAKRASPAKDELGAEGAANEPSAAEGRTTGAGSGAEALKDDEASTDRAKRKDECEITLPRYLDQLARAASPLEANRARWGAAECYARLGQVDSARRAYTALLGARAYAERGGIALPALPAEPAATAVAAAPAPAAKAAPPAASTSPKPESSASP